MIWLIIGITVGFISGAVVSYMVLRNNPNIKKKIDGAADGFEGKSS